MIKRISFLAYAAVLALACSAPARPAASPCPQMRVPVT